MKEVVFSSSASGMYLTPDPIGLLGGLNRYSYALDNPLFYSDFLGLNVDVCLYDDAARGYGHVGFGLPGEKGTTGFYPTEDPLGSPGVVKTDSQKEKQCKTVESPPDKDKCMMKCRERWKATPGEYRLKDRQCTSFVRECLRECGLPDSSYDGPLPRVFYHYLMVE
jgi:uncharacterized protein RhaS with RHS repeats